MERNEKIKLLTELQNGTKKPLDMINYGVFVWELRDGMCYCESGGFEHWILPLEQFKCLSETMGGSHIYYEKAHGSDYDQPTTSIPRDTTPIEQAALNQSPIKAPETKTIEADTPNVKPPEIAPEYDIIDAETLEVEPDEATVRVTVRVTEDFNRQMSQRFNFR